ncbi:putative WWE domain, poly(ADP-ribose) polymerase, catalytic domain, RST domain-containing protein [Helianthus annuus]|nr:putative WWE domain, poly(ADP-ribose) polymerase, catalytic domain, RST domain-containing protein [Helianthus annuus]
MDRQFLQHLVLKNIVKVAENGRRVFIDPKRKAGPTNKSLSSRPPLNKLGKRKRANECENKFLKNYSNFMKSGLPQRLLFSQDGQWVDFSQEVVNLVKEDFRLKRAAIEVDYNGCHFMLDVLRMIQVDLKTGAQKPIAWIDDAGICVFPELYSSCYGNREDLDLAESSNTREVNLQLEIELNGLDNNEVDECVGESNVKRVKVEQELSNNIRDLSIEETAKSMFIAGLGSDVKVDFLEVKKCSSGLREAQLELFQKQVEITGRLRGNANVQYGWFAAAAGALSGVMFYGRNGPKLGTYGYGIHLAAVQSNSNHLSTLICDDDENGIKHMVLCRVILGNVEAVQAGSTQFSPSDQCFDSGVDDLHNPNNYIVWNSNMNTHIFPECVVSFKTSPTIKGTGPLKGQAHCAIAGNPVGEESMPHMSRVTTTHDPHGPSNQDSSSSNKMGKSEPQTEVINLLPHEKVPSVGSSTPKEPKSPWMPFSMLFEAISPKVAPNDMRLLQIFYESFRAKNINREEFIRKLRSVVGDQILRSTISVLQTKKNPNSASMSEAKKEV